VVTCYRTLAALDGPLGEKRRKNGYFRIALGSRSTIQTRGFLRPSVDRASLRNPGKVLFDPVPQFRGPWRRDHSPPGRNNWIGFAQNESVGFQGLQRMGKHFFTHALHLPPQFTEAMRIEMR
jgi:hypothetical protein